MGYRFSIRTLLVFVAVAAICTVFYTRKTPVQQVEAMGGKILFDHAYRIYESRGPIPYPSDPAMAENSLVTGVNFDARPLSNADLVKFVRIAESNSWQIERLTIRGTKISDISPLAKLHKLHWLDIGRTRITDISALNNLNKLGVLYAEHSHVAPDSIDNLRQTLPRCAVYYSQTENQ